MAESLRLFSGQTLFSCFDKEKDHRQLLLSPIKLNPTMNYFRVYINNERGILEKICEALNEYDVNIAGYGAFVLGNLAVFEITADFKNAKGSPDMIRTKLQEIGGVVIHRRLIELIPLFFNNQTVITVEKEGKNHDPIKEWSLNIPKSIASEVGINWNEKSFAIISNYSRIPALLVEFLLPNSPIVKLSANLVDQPGALFRLSNVLKDYIDIKASFQTLLDEKTEKYMAIGILIQGNTEGIKSALENLPQVKEFNIERIGW